MSLEIQINDRLAKVDLVERNGDQIKIKVDGRLYEIDLVAVGNGVYSALHEGISYNIELISGKSSKEFYVNTLKNSYDVEIIDAETRYLKSRGGGQDDQERNISSPIPGKVVKIPVKVGDKISAGTTVVIVSAMKMESEYKVMQDRIVKDILVNEGETIDGNQTLVIVE